MSFHPSDTIKRMEKNLDEFKSGTNIGEKNWTLKTARSNIYKIIDSDDDYNKAGIIFDIFILIVILVSLVPLIFPNGGFIIKIIEISTLIIFIIEYILRLLTSKFKYTDKLGKKIAYLQFKKEELLRQRSLELFNIKNIEDSIKLLGTKKTNSKIDFIRKYDAKYREIMNIEFEIYKVNKRIDKITANMSSKSIRNIAARSTAYSRSAQGIIDFTAIISSLPVIPAGLSAFKMLRFTKFFRVLRAFKVAKVDLLVAAISKQKKILVTIFTLAFIFIFLSAVLMFQIEHSVQPEVFEDFFDALYWAVATLTTVGYGDIYPITTLGRALSMLISLTGIAIVALPAGVIASAYTEELQDEDPFHYERRQIKEIHEHVQNLDKNDKS